MYSVQNHILSCRALIARLGIMWLRCFSVFYKATANHYAPAAFNRKEDPFGELITYWRNLRKHKKNCRHLPWLTPQEAERLPYLDCKGFAVLIADRAQRLGLRAKIMIGVHAPDRIGHAYTVIEHGATALCFSSGNIAPIPEKQLLEHYQFNVVFPLIKTPAKIDTMAPPQ
jgi:hypothetical protein